MPIRRSAWIRRRVVPLTLATLVSANTTVDASSQDQLEQGVAVERRMEGLAEQVFELRLLAGEYVALTVEQRGVDVAITVRDAKGTSLAFFDSDVSLTGTERVAIVGHAEGPYRFAVQSRYAKLTGGVRLTLETRRPSTAEDRQLFEARRLAAQGQLHEAAGRPAQALEQLAKAVELARKVSPPQDQFVVWLTTRIAEMNRTLGRLDEAERLLDEAIPLADRTIGRDHPQTAYSRGRLGVLFMARDDLVRAEPLLEESVEATARSVGSDHPWVANNIISLALLYTTRRDFDRAAALLQRGISIAERTFDPKDFTYLALVNNLGDLYVQQKAYDRADPIVRRALAAIEDAFGAEHLRVSTPLTNLAIIERERGRYDAALAALTRAHAIRTVALGERNPQTASVLLSIGNVQHARGSYREAMDSYQRALDIFETAAGPYHSLTMTALSSLARTAVLLGETEKAIGWQARSEAISERQVSLNLATGSERQKLAYFDSTRQRTARTIDLHANRAPGDAAAARLAAEVVLQRKGRVLDVMAHSTAAMRGRLQPGDEALLEKLRGVTAQLAGLAASGPGRTPFAEFDERFRSLDRQREALEGDIGQRSAAFRAATQTATLEAVQAVLPADAALVEFIVYQPFDLTSIQDEERPETLQYSAYVIRSTGTPRHVPVGPARDVDAAVALFRAALRDPRRADVTASARAMDRLVLAPIRSALGDAQRLLISPDGALNLVPFEAMVDEKGAFAIESFRIQYLTSGRDLLRLARPPAPHTAPVVLADPAFGAASAAGRATPARRRSVTTATSLADTYFAPLAGTAAEARLLGSLLPDATVLTGPRASKRALLAARAPRILHLSTHGFFLDPGAPRAAATPLNPLLRSGLALAGANARPTGEGLLTALEAANLDLWGTRLVTLSACDTGVGAVRNGEGVYGLRRAFLLAGAETVLMTLWPVSDGATREIMTGYYQRLTRGLGRAESLRDAQLEMLRRPARRHPFYWAAFIQAGAGGPL